MSDYVLYHYGVPGMKWGVRKSSNAKPRYGKRMVRGHGGPGVYFGKKRQLAGDKRDLDYLNKGGHLSVGITKKRQASLDARDKRLIENRIAKNERKLAERTTLEKAKTEMRDANRAYNKAFNKADRLSVLALSPSKKHRLKSKMAWDEAWEAGVNANNAEKKYKAMLKDERAKRKAEKAANKAAKKLEKQRVNDLMKRYGQLEDQMTYGKNADVKKNARIEKELSRLDKEINKR